MKLLKIIHVSFHLVDRSIVDHSRWLSTRLEQGIEIGKPLREKAFMKSKLNKVNVDQLYWLWTHTPISYLNDNRTIEVPVSA